MRKPKLFLWGIVWVQILLHTGCTNDEPKLFTQLKPARSGISFSNNLAENDSMNYFLYKYMYQGGGIAIGDLDNDGLQDLYFTGNMVENKLYLNQGDLRFKDITQEANVAGDDRWVTGVTMADVNSDGWLDIYVSVAGRWTTRNNLLYINNGSEGSIPTFTESAEAYGIADPGNSVQSVFFDYDRDGDLDLYVANYPVTDIRTGIYNYREMMRYVDPRKSDHLYRNDQGTFTDVTVTSGIMRFGLSLGLAVGDYNQDGWPDLYVSNDFATPDYFFFNNGDGTFTDRLQMTTNHTSFFGMGVDAADINNDGLLDIMQVDMTPENNFRSKANMASMDPTSFYAMVNSGMHYQYMKNTLQLNMGVDEHNLPQYSEISELAHAALTDWSWGPLIADFDNDGWKDLFVTNGSRKEMNNKDFFKAMNKDKQQHLHYLDWVKKMPEEKIENYALKNNGDLKFEPVAADWGINFKGWSNGAAYADLDNDGDLDLVINNIDHPGIVYRNNATELKKGNYLKIKMRGPAHNRFGIGVKVVILKKGQKQYQELTLTRGFQSSVAPVIHFGLGSAGPIEKITVTWPDGRVQTMNNVPVNQQITVYHKDGAHMVNHSDSLSKPFKEITDKLQLAHQHIENQFDDFKHQVLLPHKMSQHGPALATGDLNNDGLEDFFIGGARGYAGKLYLQTTEGTFDSLQTEVLRKDRLHEDVDATFFDANNDGWLDLYVVSGGNEEKKGDKFYQDRLYINTGNGAFSKAVNALPEMPESGSVVKTADFDKDGDLDLFVGGRLSPRNYPAPGRSYLLENKSNAGEVRFIDVSHERAETLSYIGMVTDATWADINADERPDLFLAGEWMPVTIFINREEGFTNETETYGIKDHTGWWNSLIARDFDGDGDIDLVGGNLGENYKYKASVEAPFSIYVNDYDKNNKTDIVLAYVQDGEEYPLRGRQCSSEQIPAIAQKFKDYNSFAKASLADVYSTRSLEESTHYQATNFATCYFENQGDTSFTVRPLTRMAQISSVNDILATDVNSDGHLDLVLAGNLYETEVETPRNDASYGLYLPGDGKGSFVAQMPYESGLMLKGEVRKIKEIHLTVGKKAILMARNDDRLAVVMIH